MTDQPTISDLTLNCVHGNKSCLVLSKGTTGDLCPGGRVPTQAEINALAKPDYEASLVEHIRLGHVNWHEVVAAALEVMEDTNG